MMSQQVDIQEFAKRVERLCDFLLDKSKRDGTDNLKIIHDLKDDAANIQFDKTLIVAETLNGLSDYMKGAP